MDNIAWSAVAYLIMIAVLVTFHEFGHFWVARRLGVKVLRFSVGFGRALWRRVARDGTEYVIAAIPLGGYVKMLDEREGEVAEADLPHAFNRQPVWKRFLVVAAGPIFNFVLAVLLYWLVWVIGMPALKPILGSPAPHSVAAQAHLQARDTIIKVNGQPIRTWSSVRSAMLSDTLNGRRMQLQVRNTDGQLRNVELNLAKVRVNPKYLFGDIGLRPYQPLIPPLLKEVLPGGPAQAAGFKKGDLLLSYNGIPLKSWQQWVRYIQAHPDTVVKVKVRRKGRIVPLTLAVGSTRRDGKTIGHFGGGVAVSAGLWHDLQTEKRLNVVDAIPAALRQTWQMSVLTLQLGYQVLVGRIPVTNLGGPIRTAEAAGYTARLGMVAFLSFLAFVSINLGIVNLLPVPVLDGGHLLYFGIEAVRGSPLSERAQALGQQFGLTLLALLIGMVFYNDIASLMS